VWADETGLAVDQPHSGSQPFVMPGASTGLLAGVGA